MDAISRALRRVAWSPFLEEIERAPMPSRFTRPPFNSYDGRTDPMEHVSHYIHMMSLHTHNDALMCKVFPSSLEPTALRWFNRLRKGSIHSFAELIQEFGTRFVTCTGCCNRLTHYSLSRWGLARPFAIMPVGIGSYITKLVVVTKKLQQALLEWGYPRIRNSENH